MSVSQQIKQLFQSQPGALGQRVMRPAAIYVVGADNLFTIAGGNILITALYAETTIAITTAATGQVSFNPAGVGANINWDDGTLAYLSNAGDLVLLPMDVLFPATQVQAQPAPAWPHNYICSPGIIQFTVGVADTDGGLEWVLFYIPLDPDVTVVVSP